MSDPLQEAGAILRGVLEPFHKAQGRQLTSVFRKDAGEGGEIILAFDRDGLIFSCNPDLDTVAVSFGPVDGTATDVTADPLWSRFVAKEFFWGWLTMNQQGYVDGALLSFDGASPEIALNVIASAFAVLEVTRKR